MLRRKKQAPEGDAQPDSLFQRDNGNHAVCRSQGKDERGQTAVTINVMVAVGATVLQTINKGKVKAGSISTSQTTDD